MPTTAFDLAIIGGGPAGTSAGITAARAGARVVLFEAKAFPRHKVCGEFVSAEALSILSELLGQRSLGLLSSAPIIDAVRLYLGSRTVTSAVSPAARSIPRFELDQALWGAARAAGAECRAECEIRAAEGDGDFVLQTSTGSVAARSLIVAAGRWSQFTADRSLGSGAKWIGVKAHFSEANPPRSTDLYFFDGGYCGVQAVGPQAVNACAMVRSDRANSLAEVFDRHRALSTRAATWKPLMTPVNTAPLIFREPQPVRGNVILAGDAAAFIDPFVGDGISIALRSGKLAAECLTTILGMSGQLPEAVRHYEREYKRQFNPLLGAAAQVRTLLALTGWRQRVAFEALRFPGLLPFIIQKTRRAG